MPLTAKIRMGVSARQTVATDLGEIVLPQDLQYAIDLLPGTAAFQADVMWGDSRTLTASSTEDLDLAGVLTSALGGTVTFVKVNAIVVVANSGNTNNVIVGGASATQFVGPFGAATHTLAVQPSGGISLVAPGTGWSVAAGSTDLLKIANSAGSSSVTYSILLVGRSA